MFDLRSWADIFDVWHANGTKHLRPSVAKTFN